MRVDGQKIGQDIAVERTETVKLLKDQAESGKSLQTKEEQKVITISDLQAKTKKTSREDLEAATDIMNNAMKISYHHLEFELHDESDRYQVKVVDSDSKKIIREIPADNVLEFAAHIRSMMDDMIGLLVDEIV